MGEALRLQRRWTVDEYLDFEDEGGVRYEFVNGSIYAMVGATDRHSMIAGDLFGVLLNRLKPPCQVFAESMRLRLQAERSTSFYYPDSLVSCDPADRAPLWREKPIFLAEVLSPSTERTDRHEKFNAYTNIASLQEYLIILQDIPQIELHRRRAGWKPETFYLDQTVHLESVDLTLQIQQLYRRTDLARAE
jgi:Uma2 family endonuclease